MADKHHARIEADIEFADGKTRTVRPLTIKSLRKFVKLIEGLENLDASKMDDEAITKMVEAAKVVVEQTDTALAADESALEEALDMDVFQKIMTVAMGNRLVDPNV